MKKNVYTSIIVAVATIIAFAACVRKNYDAPPDLHGYDPNLHVNLTIAQLKAKMTSSLAQKIDSNWTIYGVVNADDRSGNFYKQINIEDSTGGITIMINDYNLYNKYPVGRKVYVSLKNLWYGYYAKFPELGDTVDYTGALSDIPGAVADLFITKASYPNDIPVHHFSDLSQLKTVNLNMVNRLVTIDSVEVAATDTSFFYAQPAAVVSGTSINMEDCSGNKIVLRTSGYAQFFNQKVPKGRGSITALYTIYNSTPQLVIRDTTDLKFYGPRCGGGSVTPGAGPLITMDSLRKLYPGSGTVTLPNVRVTGVVISDIDKGNVSSGNFIVEDASKKGVILYISGSTTYKLGDSVMIDVTGGKLQLYSSALELTVTAATKVTRITTGKSVVPTQVTLAQLNSSFSTYESTLVKVLNATISGSGTTYSGNKTLTDATGSVSLYTATAASFSGTIFLTGPRTVIGIPTPYTPNEIKLRDPATDVY